MADQEGPVIGDVFSCRVDEGLDKLTAKVGGRIVSCFGPLCSGSWAYRLFKPGTKQVDREGSKATLEEAVVEALSLALRQRFQTLEEALREAEVSGALEACAEL